MYLAFAVAASSILPAKPAVADEGMWTLDNFPSAAVQMAYGVRIDRAWLDHVRRNVVRLPGCSGGIVSKQGLIQTNYHCVTHCAHDLSTPSADYMKDGFRALSTGEEKRCPGSWADVLLSVSDVTARLARVSIGKTGSAIVQAQTVEKASIEKEACGVDPKTRCQVIAFYQGAQYKLYRYRRWTDVRLVFAPEFRTGFFGGDLDNFNFPRYNLDVGYLRLYEDGRPVATPDPLKWTAAAPKAGEPIFVAGNPGATQRLYSIAQLETLRDLTIPAEQLQRQELRGRLEQFKAQSADNAAIADDPLIFLENTFKVFSGRQQALADPVFMAAKRREEAELRAKVASDPRLMAEYGDPWSDIATAHKAYADVYFPYFFLESDAGSLSALFAYARTIVRGALEREKPATERPAGYDDAGLARQRAQIAQARPVPPALERIYLSHWLSKASEYLTIDDPGTKLLLGKESPEGRADRLVTGTKLADPAMRIALWDGGAAAVRASGDPMIQYALSLEEAAIAARRVFDEKITGPVAAASSRIARARFAIYGEQVYPDATFSLRISYGSVTGWTEHARVVAPFTTLTGYYDRATQADPYALADSWLKAADAVDRKTVFNFSGSGDITGGASGSPTLNSNGEIIGSVFDGNIHANGGAYGYDRTLNRSVHVANSAIREALAVVYGEQRLVDELEQH